jgi:hypothetical protein
MYLGTSPRHSRRVALVLNLQTGHVSPQFHVKFDDLFETLRPSAGNAVPVSMWQTQTGFVQGKESGRPANRAKSPGEQQNDPAGGVIPPTERDPPDVLHDRGDDG